MRPAKRHEHRWVSIRAGFPQKICKCGHMKVGTNTVLLSDFVRYSSPKAPAAEGDLGMAASGRPQFFRGGAVRDVAGLDDIAAGGSDIDTVTGPTDLAAGFTTICSITPSAGTYLVWFSTWIDNPTSGSGTAEVRIQAGGVTATDSEKMDGTVDIGAADSWMRAVTTLARVTVNGAEAITGEAREVVGGSQTANRSQLMILQVS